MCVQNHERHCIIFVVSLQHHSQNDVRIALDTHECSPPTFTKLFRRMKPNSILHQVNFKANCAYLRKILYEASFPESVDAIRRRNSVARFDAGRVFLFFFKTDAYFDVLS